MEVTKEKARQIIDSKDIVNAPGKWTVKCIYTQKERQILKGGTVKEGFAKFNAMSEWQDGEADRLMTQGEYQRAANQCLNLSILEGQFFPQVGETVELIVEKITTSNGITGLFATSVIRIPAKTPIKREVKAQQEIAIARPVSALAD